MSKAILFRSDPGDRPSKSNAVYRNIQSALERLARAEGRDIQSDYDPFPLATPSKGTTYISSHSIVALGMTAHRHFLDVVSTSVFYLNPSRAPLSEDPAVAQMVGCVGSDQASTRISFLGPRARKASVFLSRNRAACYELPPVDLVGPAPADRSRLTMINHASDDRLARSVLCRFLECTDFAIDAFGLTGPVHNRVRYLGDDEVSEQASSVHIHIGVPCRSDERIRIVDSWQSRVPVLCFDGRDDDCLQTILQDVRDNHNVMLCRSYNQACDFIALLLGTPNLYRQLVAHGRASAAPAARTWDDLARDLVA